MALSSDLDGALARARMLFAMLAAPTLRAGLGARLTGSAVDEDPGVRGPLSALDWLDAEGRIDLDTVRATAESLGFLRSDQVLLEVGRLEELPVDIEESREVSCRIVRTVFERVGPRRRLGEPELNAALAMFTANVPVVRRDAVDAGVLARTADGGSYWLAADQ